MIYAMLFAELYAAHISSQIWVKTCEKVDNDLTLGSGLQGSGYGKKLRKTTGFPKLHSPIENFIVPLTNKNELPRLS